MLAGQVGECCSGGRTSGEDTDAEVGAGLGAEAEADMDAGSGSSSDEEHEGYRHSRPARGKHRKHHKYHSHKGHGRHGKGAGAGGGAGGACDLDSTAYWGLVVQGNTASEADGCYVLKTSQSGGGAGGCGCTHFSLTRVCVGAPLYTQLRDAWLVAQQQGQQAAAAGAR